MNKSPESSEIDKEELYKENLRRSRWMDKFFRRAAHKAVDLPDEEMQINQQYQGITGKTLLGVAGLILAGVLGWRGIDKLSTPVMDAPIPAISQEYEVRFWAEDGNEIEVLEE